MNNFYNAVYRVVRGIPRGRVMTYGQIATLLGHPRAARAVGYALKASKGEGIPWQRVINSHGAISAKSEVERPILQRQLLEAEGVVFDADGCCDLRVYRWTPPEPGIYHIELSKELPFL